MSKPPSLCQGYCGVCGRVRQQEGEEPCLLATFTHHDGLPLSACAQCYKWWKIGEETHVRRLGDVVLPAQGGTVSMRAEAHDQGRRVPTSGEGQMLVMHKHKAERSASDQDTPTEVERCNPQIWD